MTWTAALGKLVYLLLMALIGGLVAYSNKQSKWRQSQRDGKPMEKPSLTGTLGEHLKDPYKPHEEN